MAARHFSTLYSSLSERVTFSCVYEALFGVAWFGCLCFVQASFHSFHAPYAPQSGAVAAFHSILIDSTVEWNSVLQQNTFRQVLAQLPTHRCTDANKGTWCASRALW
eukprot:1147182-Pelagomonas_calceolata.AAC.1